MSAQTEDQLQMLFPTIVQRSMLPDMTELDRALLNGVRQLRERQPNTKPQSWACELYTTIGNPSAIREVPGIEQLMRIALEKISNCARAYEYPESLQPVITECWVNIYGAGHSQEIHLHKNSLFSGIYYLQAPAGSGATLFYSPAADVMIEPRPTQSNNINATVTGFPPEQGQMLIFRSSTRHSVLPGDFDGERITISFNAVMQ